MLLSSFVANATANVLSPYDVIVLCLPIPYSADFITSIDILSIDLAFYFLRKLHINFITADCGLFHALRNFNLCNS